MAAPLTVAYVLVFHGAGRFPAMTYLAALATRRVEPGARLVLVTDRETPPHLHGPWTKLLDLMDETFPLDAPMPSLRARSFHLKTRVRDVTSGDLVYLDADTLPVAPFRDMAAGDWDVALVQDRNHHAPVTPIQPYWVMDRVRRAGWHIALQRYFNAGIGFYRDNAAVRAMVADWQRRWREFYAIGDDCDQVPLNCSLTTMPVRVKELPTAYNAMIAASPVHARGAKIYHFFAGNQPDMGDTLYEYLLNRLQQDGSVDWGAIDRAVAMNHPWMPPYWPKRLWQTGNHWRALQGFTANSLRRISGQRN